MTTTRKGRGVAWDQRRLRWKASVWIDGERKQLGRFRFEQDAVDAVLLATGELLPEPPLEPMSLDEWELIAPDIGPTAEWYHERDDYKLPDFPVAEPQPEEKKPSPKAVGSLTELSIW
jgi:hypothetical protein